MKFIHENAEIYIPSGCENGLERTTDLCVAAHQDDVEIMSYAPISDCYKSEKRFFTAVVATDGAGSPRKGKFADCTDDEMKKIRISEQKKAADVGDYTALVLLGYKSGEIKDKDDLNAVDEIAKVILAAKPENIYIHNFADKHDTHVATAVKTLKAIRKIRNEFKPKKLYMMEVWRGLDWLCDYDKVLFDASKYPNLAKEILDVYESQIAGGKRYDLAAIGRRYANATFFESHDTDSVSAVSYALDASSLIESDETPNEFMQKYVDRFKSEVEKRLEKM